MFIKVTLQLWKTFLSASDKALWEKITNDPNHYLHEIL